jgi:4'-phosphopantetheinyl transferase
MAADAATIWAAGPQRPRIPPGAIDVWRARPELLEDELSALLCEQEHRRAQRLHSRVRLRWMRSRGVLRLLLGRYLEVDPSSLRFTQGEHGKPALREHPSLARTAGRGARTAALEGPAGLRFNLSHSGDLVLCAIAAGVEVGVDIEIPRRKLDAVALARRTFGEAEATRLQALAKEDRTRELLRGWVRHEARLKCLGVGLSGQVPAGVELPWTAWLDVGGGALAAVAAETAPRELRCWQWRG